MHVDADVEPFVSIPFLHACAQLDIHPAVTVLAVRQCHEAGIVILVAILCIHDDRIILFATASKVVLLEVAQDLVKAVSVVQVMHEVAHVEELHNCRIDVLLCLVKHVGAVHLRQYVLVV